jgi:hypothetical protein
MGSEFLQRTQKTINAARDRDRERLALETLFTRHPECAHYAGRAKPYPGANLKKGDEVLVEEREGKLFVSSGLGFVAEFVQPPQGMVDAVECAGGIVAGTVVTVMAMINIVEIVLCP